MLVKAIGFIPYSEGGVLSGRKNVNQCFSHATRPFSSSDPYFTPSYTHTTSRASGPLPALKTQNHYNHRLSSGLRPQPPIMFMFTWPRPNQEKEPDAVQDSIGAEGNGIRRDEIHDDVDEETDRGDLTFVAQITMNIFAAFAFLLLSFFAIFTNDYGVSAVVKSSKAATTVFKGSVEHRSGESTPADQTKLLAGAPKDKADDLDAGILGKPGVAAVTNRASISNFRGGKGHDDDGPKITMNGRALKETSQSSGKSAKTSTSTTLPRLLRRRQRQRLPGALTLTEIRARRIVIVALIPIASSIRVTKTLTSWLGIIISCGADLL